jgi:leucyl-tRNA synthetase
MVKTPDMTAHGHVRNDTTGRCSRTLQTRGFDVLHRMGWDAFAE